MQVLSRHRGFVGIAVVFLLVILLAWVGQQVHVGLVGQGE